MAKLEGENPNFDDLTPLDDLADDDPLFAAGDATDEPLAEEAVAESPLDEEAAVESPASEEEPVEAAKPTDEEEEAEEPSKLPLLLEVVGLAVLVVGLLAIASRDIIGGAGLGLLSIWTSLYVIALVLNFYALWKSRRTGSLFTVFLGCTLAALLTAVYCLWMELAVNYRFDINAQEAKRKVGMVLPVEHGQPNPLPNLSAAPAQPFVA